MEKAAKHIRRSGVKLLSLGGGHSELNLLISEMKDVRNSSKNFMNAQTTASQYLTKWAAREDNRAIQDVSSQMEELNMLWTEAQREFAEHLKEFKQMFDMILEGEKHVDMSKNNLGACELRETKIKKELKKAAKKSTTEELRQLENKLMQAERAKNLAQLEVTDRLRENEAVKIIRYKEGMLRLSEAYVELGRKCAIIFEAQRDMAHQLPDVHDREIEDIKYTGSGATRKFVMEAKEKVRQYRRQSHRLQPQPTVEPYTGLFEAPPPYSAIDLYQQDLPPTVTGRSPARQKRQKQEKMQREVPQEEHHQQHQQEQQHEQLEEHFLNIEQDLPLDSARVPSWNSYPGSDGEIDDLAGAMGGAKI
ncbi:uncharacterized protein LOC106163101 [Lingula anatina]|uniref:Uncharacterized protein LOC106163101 n=1 Tax=Lingula anatina TaxID=7574 RepID=A0A1S3ICV3_LINAN|nr:uncharacterized protein LOC106163101 [Lingula anatina]|eukprot:XP_013396067.1 uncharacterized protein LOC106163101 [Lingula anatina]